MTLRTIATDGAEMCVEDSGRDEPALVFLHYWGGSARTWSPVTRRLPEQVPAEVRAGMLASYQSREGVLQALKVLAGSALDGMQREQVIEDTLRGDAEAKRYWPEQGMTADISTAIRGLELPVDILVGEQDQVERESVLRPLFSRLLPDAMFAVVPGVGHLIPLEAPQAVASHCGAALATAG